jgi:hypothetical protein
MKKYILILCTILLAGVLPSCVLDDDVPGNSGTTGKSFTLKYTVEGRTISTYATVAPETGEDVVKSLHLLFFHASDDNTGAFIEALEVKGPLSMNTTIPVVLPPETKLAITGTAYNVLAVANLTENKYLGSTNIEDWCTLLKGRTEKMVMEESIAHSEQGRAILPDELLMQGRTSKAAGTGYISLVLTRNLARFDVSNSKRQDYDLMSVSVRNAYPQSSIFGRGVLDYSTETTRFRTFYGISNPNVDSDGTYPDIKGGLYAFENNVPFPRDNDEQTTCLIIGLKDRKKQDNQPTYYRVNIRPKGSAQALKRNNVYRVTINNVFGPGANTEDEAYTGIGSDLDYTINYWDLDDNGLIVQDGTNILAVPTKLVQIGPSGGEFSYSIYTFSSTGKASPLQIKSQTWEPQTSDIQATLNGNTLVISATPMGSGAPDRQGVITLTFAGLEASITVIQSNSLNTFLEVLLPGGKIPPFGASAGIGTGDIEVRASGPWTAKMFGDEALSFDRGETPVRQISVADGSAQIRDDKYFKVWTHSENGTSNPKETFIIVSLDSDPVNYVSVITLIQNPKGGLTVIPDNIFFSTTDYETPQTVTIDGKTTSGDRTWTAELTGTNADKFTLSAKEGDGQTAKTFSVGTKEQNLSGGAYSATIRVALKQDPSAYTDIIVTQQSSHFSVAPGGGTFGIIPKTGGETPSISINADPSFKWSATVTTTATNAEDGRSLINHEAYLVDQYGKKIVPGSVQELDTQFRVGFGKVYWPNREITGITATVTVTLHDANGNPTPLTYTFTVSQESLLSAGLYAANMLISGSRGAKDVYGSLLNKKLSFRYYNAMTHIFKVKDDVPYPNTTFLHACAHGLQAGASGWHLIKNFIKERDAVTVLSMKTDAETDVLNDVRSPFPNMQYTFKQPKVEGHHNAVSVNTSSNVIGRRVYKFLITNGRKTPVPMSTKFYMDDLGIIATALPKSAVPVLVATRVSGGGTCLAVDPANKVIFIGDLQTVGYDKSTTDYVWTNNMQNFLDNLVLYIAQAAEYGSHFTDLLNDYSGVPDIWDEVWGNNAQYKHISYDH